MDDAGAGFADELARHGRQIFEEAEPAITRLSLIAESLKMPAARAHIDASLEGLRRPTFTMIVFGRFNTGKSTFLNVLLGRLERPLAELPRRIGAPLPMDDMPVNARVTTIRYGEQPSVTVVRDGGRREERSLAWFLDNSPLRATRQENAEAFGDIEQFELTYPFENGRAGIVLIDTPGTDDAPDRTVIALQALNQADAAILLFNTTGLAGQGEVEFARDMISLGLTNYFTVINRYNGRAVDERLRHYAWDRLVHELRSGPDFEGQDFADHKIYFVDALAALEGRLTGDTARVAGSGIEPFEAALGQFYETERRKVHVQRWTDQAIGQAAKIDAFVTQQIPALMLEREEFQRRYEEIQPRVRELQTRKGHPARIFNRFRQRAADNLVVGFQELVLQVADELPAALKDKQLTSLKDIGSKVWSTLSLRKHEEVAKEAAQLVSDIFCQRLKAWETADPTAPGVRRIMDPMTQDLVSELRDEVNRTEKDFQELKLSLVDQFSGAGEVRLSNPGGAWWQRIAPAAALSIIVPPDVAVTAVQGGKGLGKSLVLHLAGAVVVFGLIGAPATLPVMAAYWIGAFLVRGVWQGHDLQKEAKAGAIRAFIDGLRTKVGEARPKLMRSLEVLTREFEETVSAGYAEEIDQQISDLLKMERESALSRDDKAALVEQYGKVSAEVARHAQTLAYVRSLAAI